MMAASLCGFACLMLLAMGACTGSASTEAARYMGARALEPAPGNA